MKDTLLLEKTGHFDFIANILFFNFTLNFNVCQILQILLLNIKLNLMIHFHQLLPKLLDLFIWAIRFSILY